MRGWWRSQSKRALRADNAALKVEVAQLVTRTELAERDAMAKRADTTIGEPSTRGFKSQILSGVLVGAIMLVAGYVFAQVTAEPAPRPTFVTAIEGPTESIDSLFTLLVQNDSETPARGCTASAVNISSAAAFFEVVDTPTPAEEQPPFPYPPIFEAVAVDEFGPTWSLEPGQTQVVDVRIPDDVLAEVEELLTEIGERDQELMSDFRGYAIANPSFVEVTVRCERPESTQAPFRKLVDTANQCAPDPTRVTTDGVEESIYFPC